MKTKQILSLLTCLVLTGCNSCTDTTKKITSKTVKTTKETLTGIKEGIDEGRKEAESVDGAIIASTLKELEGKAELSIGKVEKTGDNSFSVELIINNSLEKPLRIIGLTETGVMILKDTEGFAAPLHNSYINDNDITVLPQSKQKFKYSFYGEIGKPALTRIMGKEIPVVNYTELEQPATKEKAAVPPKLNKI